VSKRVFRVVWSEAASGDLNGIVAFIADDSPAAARRVHARIKARAGGLKAFAERGRVVPELAYIDVRTFRELVDEPYRLVYRIEGARVIVMAVFDGRRDLQQLLLERLVRT